VSSTAPEHLFSHVDLRARSARAASPRLEDQGPNTRQLGESVQDERPYVSPRESAKPTAKGWHCHATYPTTRDLGDQRVEAARDISEVGPLAPVTLRWEMNDEARTRRTTRVDDLHAAKLQLTVTASPDVFPESVWIGVLELQREALTHDTDAVYWIDQRFNVSV
jgi:hypothetical protein